VTEQQSISLQTTKRKMNRISEMSLTKNQRNGCIERTARMNGHRGHRVHVWLGDVFDRYGDVEIPCADGLVIRRGNEPPIVIHESNRVDRPQMLIILLRDFARPHVVLGGDGCHSYRE